MKADVDPMCRLSDNGSEALTNQRERLTAVTKDPDGSIVAVPQEPFSKWQIFLENYAPTRPPFRLVYADGNSLRLVAA